jgi:broad specificity phosphatase PhoE
VIYLIRHGETEWSLSGQHTGRTDIPLTPSGEDAARRLGDRLRDVTFAAAFTSPRRRAIETWKLSALSPEAGVNDDLAEWDYGDYEGLTSAEIKARRPGWNVFADGCPNGESPADVLARADRVIAWLRGLPGPVAICAHGHFGRALGARWIGLPIVDAGRLLLSTASVSILDYEHGQIDRPAVLLWNEASTAPREGTRR